MDLNNMKDKWNKLGEESKGEINISKDQLLNITQSKYSKNISKIFISEIFFSLLYLFLLVLFLAFNNILESKTLKFLAYLAILILIILPLLNLRAVYRFYKTGDVVNSYSETLDLFKRQCQQFIKIRYVGLGLNMLLLLLCVILIPKIYTEYLTVTATSISFLIFGVIAFIISNLIWRYYKKQILRNEELIVALKGR